MNECLTNHSMGRILDCFARVYTHITFTQSHRQEDEIPDSYDKCEPGFKQGARFMFTSSVVYAVRGTNEQVRADE